MLCHIIDSSYSIHRVETRQRSKACGFSVQCNLVIGKTVVGGFTMRGCDTGEDLSALVKDQGVITRFEETETEAESLNDFMCLYLEISC